MPYRYEPRKGEVETVARVITRAMGLDPDEPAAPGSDIPLWHSYWQVARDALLAADGVRSQGEQPTPSYTVRSPVANSPAENKREFPLMSIFLTIP
jgi:hypothetical protein